MDIHTWEGPEEPIASGCAVRGLTISQITDTHAEGTITAVDYIEHGIVFSDPWEATIDEKKEWSVKRKNDGTAFWDDRQTGEVYFTLNSAVNASIKTFVVERIKVFLETKQEKIGPLKMDENDRAKAFEENRLFKVGSSFLFAAQIPDDSVGCSGSRCSNCSHKVAYCEQRCSCCGFPFIGPSGFPQFPEWKPLNPTAKKKLVEDVYMRHNKGRLGFSNVEFVPLTSSELRVIENLGARDSEHFISAHSISPQDIKGTLFEK